MSYYFYRYPVAERFDRARTPFGEVPISTIYGFDYPLSSSTPYTSYNIDSELDRWTDRRRDLNDCVDSLIRTSRAMSESRLSDPYYDVCHDLSYWPMAENVRRSRARSLSPFRESTPLPIPMTPTMTPSAGVNRPLRSRTPPPIRTTSISYSSTTPWNTTGFYYSPRYPEAYRGTSSTLYPYTYSRRYYDYDVLNPYRREYFKYPDFYFTPPRSNRRR